LTPKQEIPEGIESQSAKSEDHVRIVSKETEEMSRSGGQLENCQRGFAAGGLRTHCSQKINLRSGPMAHLDSPTGKSRHTLVPLVLSVPQTQTLLHITEFLEMGVSVRVCCGLRTLSIGKTSFTPYVPMWEKESVTRGFTLERNLTNATNVAKLSGLVHTLFSIVKFTLEKNPMSVMNVGKLLAHVHLTSNI
jgi:hypothetical protein